ncbi:AAA family ATPase [uncultured Mucilaginibacter sp.]|uniref:AAA family ATPase n=1 Tax=uncultured Mucilaginibacter sp. TaxID=797541 RepID=UPI0026111E5C|nr:AAA family ATPase [uncultured Mucilaginibacter sp.]
MKITKLELKNFKRFDNLTIDLTSLVKPAKLVLLIGTNGSGKSSVFDAFEFANKVIRHDVYIEPTNPKPPNGYYEKNKFENYYINIFFDYDLIFSNSRSVSQVGQFPYNTFYGRTSNRQITKLTRTALGQGNLSFENDRDRPDTFIDRDDRFENDIEKVASSILTDVFKGNYSTEQIIESYINPINKAFINIFGVQVNTKVELTSFKPPLEGNTAEILFKKGTSTIPYNLLSSGEKEIFNILLNLLTRKEYFQDTIYFLDEIDLHLNTQLQKNLLKEISENWIPENCQLWTASHSLGFIEYANEAEHAAIIDFDNLNFDVPQIITPSPKKNFDVFEIAVSKEFLSKVFEGKRIIFSENTDTSRYNNLKLENTVFFVGKDKADVFHKAKNSSAYDGLIDRDYLTDEERIDLLHQYNNLYILNYYSIENYFYHPDNLEEHYKTVGKDFSKEAYLEAIAKEKESIKSQILIRFPRARDGYPFYREKENEKKLKAFRFNDQNVLQMIESADFETFYKVFPAKDYGKQIRERQNLNPSDLAKTNWFKTKIEEVLTK